MKKMILVLFFLVFVIGCSSTEQKISDCIEACVCVGDYEQPNRDKSDLKFACKMTCDNAQYQDTPLSEQYLDDLDTKLSKFKSKCASYTGEINTKKIDTGGKKHTVVVSDINSDRDCFQTCGSKCDGRQGVPWEIKGAYKNPDGTCKCVC